MVLHSTRAVVFIGGPLGPQAIFITAFSGAMSLGQSVALKVICQHGVALFATAHEGISLLMYMPLAGVTATTSQTGLFLSVSGAGIQPGLRCDRISCATELSTVV